MPRCYVCDFSTDTIASIYHAELVMKRSLQNNIIRDIISGKDICLDCFHASEPKLHDSDIIDEGFDGH